MVHGRVKELKSLADKARKKGYVDPLYEADDIVGVRVVVLFLADLPRVDEIISQSFEVLNAENKVTEGDPASFGYMSVHYLATLKDHHSGPRYDDLKDIPFEIQTRTIVMPTRSLIAPAAVCPGQADSGAPIATQVRAMYCLTNFARRGNGLADFGAARALERAAAHKSADILRCDEFSHEACGRPFTYWIERFGYLGSCGGAGENIAWGSGELGSPRKIFAAWMRSPGHRENILGPFAQIGIGLRIGALEGVGGAHVWTQDFGSHDC